MGDWYRDHDVSPEVAGDEVYREWAQDNGAHVDQAGNVFWPGDRDHPDTVRQEDES